MAKVIARSVSAVVVTLLRNSSRTEKRPARAWLVGIAGSRSKSRQFLLHDGAIALQVFEGTFWGEYFRVQLLASQGDEGETDGDGTGAKRTHLSTLLFVLLPKRKPDVAEDVQDLRRAAVFAAQHGDIESQIFAAQQAHVSFDLALRDNVVEFSTQ